MRQTLAASLAVSSLFFLGCGLDVDFEAEAHWKPREKTPQSCECEVAPAAWTGETLLKPHVDEHTYLRSVLTFTDLSEATRRNEWDLSLEPSTKNREDLVFRTNLVTDDDSCLEDLGAIRLADVPAQPTKCDDFVEVREGHVYFVKSKDTERSVLGVVVVTKLDAVNSATVRWFRSKSFDRFNLEW